ncbi:MAG TPA: hypothetical protein GXX25_12555 [Desulfotomaculum sp.]|nr:hypothetical protein [Desulfotomaculum sp.]
MRVELDKLLQPHLKRYLGEWLLFEVIETDRNGWPKKVHFVAHHPDREKLTDIALEKNIQRTLVRFAGEVIPEGMEAIL